jgi:hypothetical protein
MNCPGQHEAILDRETWDSVIGYSDQRASQIGRETTSKRRGSGFKKINGAVGPLQDEALPGKFDLRLGDLEHRGHRREHGGF